MSALPSLIGVIHLPALPGAPGHALGWDALLARVREDAAALANTGFDAVMVENFGDTPFYPNRVPAITVAAMTRAALAAREAAPDLMLGVNVLRNDAEAALAVAAATGASLVRVNVHVGASVTDQGVVEGRAYHTVRLRRAWGLGHVRLLCDVAVKHAAPLAARPIAEEAEELAQRARADAVLVTGSGTGRAADDGRVDEVVGAVGVPVYVASGATAHGLPALLRPRGTRRVHGVVVGSCLRKSGRAGDPIDPGLALDFARAFRAAVG
ncbi:MAG: BtpA/SgcQ family protein [Polyangiaceae bacterium]